MRISTLLKRPRNGRMEKRVQTSLEGSEKAKGTEGRRKKERREGWRGQDECRRVQWVSLIHAHARFRRENLGRRRKNATSVCYRLFPGKMGRDAGFLAEPMLTRPTLCCIWNAAWSRACYCAGRPPMYLETAPFWCLLRINKREDVFSMFANKGTKRRVWDIGWVELNAGVLVENNKVSR